MSANGSIGKTRQTLNQSFFLNTFFYLTRERLFKTAVGRHRVWGLYIYIYIYITHIQIYLSTLHTCVCIHTCIATQTCIQSYIHTYIRRFRVTTHTLSLWFASAPAWSAMRSPPAKPFLAYSIRTSFFSCNTTT